MAKLPISVFIITLNEEKNIARALKSVDFAEEIIVVDSGSTDATIEIVKSFGIEPVHNDWPGYSKQKQFAMDLCQHEWVLNIDADEEVNSALVERFIQVMESDDYASVRCLRHDVFMGSVLSPLTRLARNTRFYKKTKAVFDDTRLVHERVIVTGKELLVSEHITHYGYPGIELFTDKKNKYSSLKAKEKHLKGKKFSYLKLFLIFPLVFFQEWLFKRKIFSGVPGLVLSIIQAHYAFIKEAKLYEFNAKDNEDDG